MTHTIDFFGNMDFCPFFLMYQQAIQSNQVGYRRHREFETFSLRQLDPLKRFTEMEFGAKD
jgi:hypothetical protein